MFKRFTKGFLIQNYVPYDDDTFAKVKAKIEDLTSNGKRIKLDQHISDSAPGFFYYHYRVFVLTQLLLIDEVIY